MKERHYSAIMRELREDNDYKLSFKIKCEKS